MTYFFPSDLITVHVVLASASSAAKHGFTLGEYKKRPGNAAKAGYIKD